MNTEQLGGRQTLPEGAAYYDGPDMLDGLVRAMREAGLDPDDLQIDDLSTLDEFHALGRPATHALADLARVEAGERIVDVGAGIGGPARLLASRYGATVTAVDATPRFCKIAEELTRGTGLTDRVEIVNGNALALPFADASFDLAWTQAVSQNISDKQRFVAEMARVVRPGGRVAMFEVVAGSGGPLEFPVPWADREDQSWLVSSVEMHGLLDSGPLRVCEWREGPSALDAIASAAQSLAPPPGHGLGLHTILPDFEARMAGLARNVAGQRIALIQAVALREQ